MAQTQEQTQIIIHDYICRSYDHEVAKLDFSASFCLFAYMYMAAAKLSVLLHVCFLCNPSLPIYSWLLLGLHQEDPEFRGDINLESNDQNPCFHCTNNIQLLLYLVCWRTHCFSYISNQHKPGLYFEHCLIHHPVTLNVTFYYFICRRKLIFLSRLFFLHMLLIVPLILCAVYL
jgi:hypothetical protein